MVIFFPHSKEIWESWHFKNHTVASVATGFKFTFQSRKPICGGKSPLLNLFSPIRWGRSQQLPSVAAGKNGAAGWRGGSGLRPPPSPPSPQRPGWRCFRGGGTHVHHERIGRGHGALTCGSGVRRQLRLALTRLPDGHVARLQPETKETGEEDVKKRQRTLSFPRYLSWTGGVGLLSGRDHEHCVNWQQTMSWKNWTDERKKRYFVFFMFVFMSIVSVK